MVAKDDAFKKALVLRLALGFVIGLAQCRIMRCL